MGDCLVVINYENDMFVDLHGPLQFNYIASAFRVTDGDNLA